jgi:hypothetical protein
MANIVVLNSREHVSVTVQRKASALYGDDQRFVEVVITEFPLLAVRYPVLLSKNSDTGGFFCGAMFGFDPGENLFLSAEGHDGYRPLNLQRAPFYVSGEALGIDLESPRVTARGGERLFDEDGQATPYLLSVAATFKELKQGLEMTRLFIKALLEFKLLAPMEVKLSFDDGTTRELHDLYTIDQEALRQLPDADVLELFRRGYLHLIYLMVGSLKQIPYLASRKNARLLEDEGAF